jgi:hypothetical protein
LTNLQRETAGSDGRGGTGPAVAGSGEAWEAGWGRLMTFAPYVWTGDTALQEGHCSRDT